MHNREYILSIMFQQCIRALDLVRGFCVVFLCCVSESFFKIKYIPLNYNNNIFNKLEIVQPHNIIARKICPKSSSQ